MKSSLSYSEEEFDSDYKQANYDLLIKEIKELKITLKYERKKLLHL